MWKTTPEMTKSKYEFAVKEFYVWQANYIKGK